MKWVLHVVRDDDGWWHIEGDGTSTERYRRRVLAQVDGNKRCLELQSAGVAAELVVHGGDGSVEHRFEFQPMRVQQRA
jgi:hypothetical protein